MTVENRIKLLRQYEQDEKSRAAAQQKAREQIASGDTEDPKVKRIRQAQLLEELREFGVISMIEELTEQSIRPFLIETKEQTQTRLSRAAEGMEPVEGGGYVSREKTPEEKEEQSRSIYRMQNRHYEASHNPGDPDLKITITDKRPYLDHSHTSLRDLPYVTIRYDRSRLLTISGEDAFAMFLTDKNPSLVDNVEEALAKALLHPRKVVPETLSDYPPSSLRFRGA